MLIYLVRFKPFVSELSKKPELSWLKPPSNYPRLSFTGSFEIKLDSLTLLLFDKELLFSDYELFYLKEASFYSLSSTKDFLASIISFIDSFNSCISNL